MPRGYVARFNEDARRTHATIVMRRGAEPVALGLFADSSREGQALCVVADDQPGLLARISAAFVAEGLEIISAEARTRRALAGQREAVDTFWVRPHEGALDEARLARLTVGLARLIQGKELPLTATEAESAASGGSGGQTVVRFLEDKDGGLTTLEVETDDRPGLLLALATALFEARVQIVASEVTTNGRRALDRFTITEFDDSPIGMDRRLLIQVGVLSAVERHFRRRSVPPRG